MAKFYINGKEIKGIVPMKFEQKCNPNNQWHVFIHPKYGTRVFIDPHTIKNSIYILGLIFHLN